MKNYPKMGVKVVAPPHAGAIWRERLGSAFRTAIACTIIGCTALYGPDNVRNQIQYPSVAYVTAILIVSDATLGTTLRGSWNAFCATVLVVPSTLLCFWVVGPSKFTEAGATVAVALSAFVVAIPECLPILTKRIAFAQLVIIYVGAVVRGGDAGPVSHPVHIAACTALGASGSVLALILPYPRLAVTEVKKQFQSYTENASDRSNLYLKAFLSQDKSTADDLIAQAEPFAKSGTRLIRHINRIQEGVKWERHRVRDFKKSYMKMGDRLNSIETPINGMKMALSAISSFPVGIVNDELKTYLQSEQVKQMLKLEHAKCFVPYDDAVTVPENKNQLFDKSVHPITSISPNHKNLPVFFFLSCFEQLINNSTINPKPESLNGQKTNNINVAEESKIKETMTQWCKDRFVFALKCSVSLGFAILLGMFFDKKNGYWSGLTIAISFVEGRQPIFTVANNRIQGTAIGSVYGVLGSCLLNQMAEIRFIIILPWIVFTSMLQNSQMYGESGGIAAVIGALLILGRKNYGPPREFAIARLTEVSIGLFCMVLLEIIVQPVRPATLVKRQVARCLRTLDECINQIPDFLSVNEKIKGLKSDINGLKNLIKDAKSEPSFWFLPFKASCYENTQERLSSMVDLMQIMIYNTRFITSMSQSCEGGWKELQEHIVSSLNILKETTSPCVKRLQKIALVKSNDVFDQESEGFFDLELGSQPTSEAGSKLMDSFVQHMEEVKDTIQGDEECKRKTVFHLNSLGFCIGCLVREATNVEICVKKMIRCENPDIQVEFIKKACYKNDMVNSS
ncbi:hypothetical protein HanHA300_Chr08g0287681 [Helianthus annuus]|nr:hypothetical protein HanHA300_Chr08g0287681 [Helianthus annuus]KAJ0719887.1 hypothetical protein HanLR1_Chr08g0286761 [Helianthus annuus]KAJ0723116.1 hypothetical protein HanOQP8_Chr08g0294291 [Helianthus annuus]